MTSKCNIIPMPITSTHSVKCKRNILSLKTKMKVIEEYEQGKCRAELMEKYGLKKTTMHGILKAKDKIRESIKKLRAGPRGMGLFRSRKLPFEDLDNEVFEWYKEQQAKGVPTRGLDIQLAAVRLAVRLGHENFKCSDGWLWRFRRRHNIFNKNRDIANTDPDSDDTLPDDPPRVQNEELHWQHGIVNETITGEMLNVDHEAVDPFKEELKQIIKDEGFHHLQIYNADETGLFWRLLPRTMRASREICSTPGHLVMKDRVSVLLCSNADGSHRLQPVIVGKSKCPRALKDIMNQLPVKYHGNKSAWFTLEIFTDWFHRVFDPEVRSHQALLGVKSDEMKALLLLDNAPIHPSISKVTSQDGLIRAIFLPPNTSTLIQPMDQGVTESCKRYYRSLYMQQCLVIDDDEDEPGDINSRRKKTLQNFKKYSLKDTIHNWAEAWKKVPLNILQNAWSKLLDTPEVTCTDFKGFDTGWIGNMLAAAGQGELREEELLEWLNEDADVTGPQHLTEEFLAMQRPKEEEVVPGPSIAAEMEKIPGDFVISQTLGEGEEAPGPSLAAGIDAVDTILSIIDKRGGSLMKHYEMMQILRLELLQQQQ